MAAKIADIADAIVTSLNGGSFTQTVVAARKWRPPVDLVELAAETTARVYVIPAERLSATERTSRRDAGRIIDYFVDVTILKFIDATDAAAADAWAALVEELDDHLAQAGRMAFATWQNSVNSPLYDPALYDDDQIFVSVVRHRYRLPR